MAYAHNFLLLVCGRLCGFRIILYEWRQAELHFHSGPIIAQFTDFDECCVHLCCALLLLYAHMWRSVHRLYIFIRSSAHHVSWFAVFIHLWYIHRNNFYLMNAHAECILYMCILYVVFQSRHLCISYVIHNDLRHQWPNNEQFNKQISEMDGKYVYSGYSCSDREGIK